MTDQLPDAHPRPSTNASAAKPAGSTWSTIVPGTGRQITPGWCAFHSTCTTRAGALVECSRRRGAPWKAVWGAGMLLPGLETALAGMREGERRLVEVPAALAFGAAGARPAIAPDTDLVYDVELIEMLDDGWLPAADWNAGPEDPGIVSA